MKIKIQKDWMIALFLIILTIGLVVGMKSLVDSFLKYSPKESEHAVIVEENDAEAIECRRRGGIPIQSFWTGRLGNCIFQPK